MKFTVPTVTDGYVFVGAENEVDVYSLLHWNSGLFLAVRRFWDAPESRSRLQETPGDSGLDDETLKRKGERSE